MIFKHFMRVFKGIDWKRVVIAFIEYMILSS